ncbi:GNAT family N-acetyltransferase [Cellvibrio zantedeschiae]|nr:GNAT family N-acetyltransferase [Cellvibrio zantedeschiae]
MTCDISFAKQVYHSLPESLRSPYHNPDYVALDAKQKYTKENQRISAVFFIYQKGGETYYQPLHRVFTPAFKVTDFESARGYGGPISTSNDREFLEEALAEYKKFSVEHDALAEFVRFTPALANQEIYYGNAWFDRTTCAIDLTDYSVEKNSHGAISNINKAIKNNCHIVFVDEPSHEQAAAFDRIYRARMQALGAGEHYLYSKDYVGQLVTKGNQLALVERNGEILAASIFLRSGNWHEYHLSAATPEGQQLGVINLILHNYAMRYAMKEPAGSAILHLGGGTDTKPDNNLLKFKRSIGKLEQPFFVGKYIHQPGRYEKLKLECAGENNRVLFYR